MERVVGNLEVRCGNNNLGCEWTGDLREYQVIFWLYIIFLFDCMVNTYCSKWNGSFFAEKLPFPNMLQVSGSVSFNENICAI